MYSSWSIIHLVNTVAISRKYYELPLIILGSDYVIMIIIFWLENLFELLRNSLILLNKRGERASTITEK